MNLRSPLRLLCVLCGLGGLFAPVCVQAQTDAHSIVVQAMQMELDADTNDHSRWRYRDDQRELGTVSIVVETDHGSVKRLIERGGKPLSAEEAAAEDARLRSFINDQAALQKQRRDSAQDGKSARELTKMLPDAFVWNVTGEDAQRITLHFAPNPKFSPPDIQSRVLGAMEGEMVVDRAQHRVVILSGRLMQDVTFGWGILGRMQAGGTFRVERREIAPKLWQITETHVHIQGKVLFFKSISQQQDEIQSEFTQVPSGTTLAQAVEMSKSLK